MEYLIIIGVVAALAVVYIFLVAPARLPKNADSALFETVYAHRGLHSKDRSVPENSLAAFEAAAAAGYGIELDVHLLSDGQVAVFHDDTLSRMCGVDKALSHCTYGELRDYRLLQTTQGIPLFSEVLRAVNGRVPILVELKHGKANKLLCEKTAALLDGYSGVYFIESFNPFMLSWFKKYRPNVVRGQLASGYKCYGGLPFYQGMLLSMMAFNFLGRPHFAAYRQADARGRLCLWLFRRLGGKLVGWTACNADDMAFCRSIFDTVIFEFIRP